MSTTKPDVVLTGISGFVGSHLALYLASQGWKVHGLCRQNSQIPAAVVQSAGIQIHRPEANIESLSNLFSTLQPKVVFHLASCVIARHRDVDVLPLIESNLLFGSLVLEAMVGAGVRNFVNTGTAWEHSGNGTLAPICLYAATKTAFQNILDVYVKTNGIKAITLKLFDTYGPHDPRKKLIPLLLRTLETQTELKMSPGEQKLDLVYVSDILKGFELAGESLLNNEVASNASYVISSKQQVSVRDLVKAIEKVTGKTLPVRFGALPYRQGEIMVPWSGGEWIANWQPKISLDRGLSALFGKGF